MAGHRTGDRVHAEQVRLLYRLSLPAYVGTLINASIVVFALWGVVSSTLLGAWLCVMFIVTGARFLLYRAYQGVQPPDAEANRWAWRFTVGAGIAGLLWGLAGSALFPASSLPHQFLVIFLIGGMTMVAMVILAPVRQAFLAFMLPAITLLCVTVFLQGTMLHLFMGALIVVYGLLLLSITPIISEMMRGTLRVKFENTALVEKLSDANRELSERVGAQQRADEGLRQSEQLYRYMFEANPLPMWIRDERTMAILAVNEATLRSYGYSREEFLQLKSTDIIASEDIDRYLETMSRRDPGQTLTSQWRHRRKGGSVMDVETVSHGCELGGRQARLILVNDVTERKRGERRMRMEQTINRLLADARSVEDALPQVLRAIGESGGWLYGARWEYDKAANLLRCTETWCVDSPAVKEFTAFSRTRMQAPGSGTGPIHQVWASNAPAWIADIARDGGTRRAPEALKAGLRSMFAFPIMLGDAFYGVAEFFGREPGEPEPELIHFVQILGGQIGQFIARKQAEKNLQFFASHDPLTGLFNRSIFNDRLQQALAQAARFERSLALLFIDLDGFKLVNDSLGHNVGDALLAELATRLRVTLREGDVIGRMGGDEFVVLIEEFAEATQVAEVAKKVLETVTRPFTLQGRECQVTASIGISIFPGDGKEAQTLMKNADIAMYQVKQRGKNSFRFHSPDMNVHLMERLSLETGLRQAIQHGEFLLLYQPKVGVRDGQVSGVEALMRWQHPTQGMISPAEFVPVAEDAGLIATMGEWVLRTACRQVRVWREQGLPLLRIAVNLSPRQLAHDGLIQVVREALHHAMVDPGRLELEITEEMALRNPERAARLVAQLKDLGARVVIDDFGTGYSSLSFLRRMPIDSVKIDRSLILDLPRDDNAAAMTRGVVAMAHSLGIAVTAEGVETREQWEYLHQLGCEEMQGNYFCAPIAPEIVPGIVRQPSAPGRGASVQPLRPRRGEGGTEQQ
ncbi:MAG TPA: EAL domain-containing protein [Burkholderiales bacterium]|nr:EAL domain-containing protein [Burkholderiales bacterium]